MQHMPLRLSSGLHRVAECSYQEAVLQTKIELEKRKRIRFSRTYRFAYGYLSSPSCLYPVDDEPDPRYFRQEHHHYKCTKRSDPETSRARGSCSGKLHPGRRPSGWGADKCCGVQDCEQLWKKDRKQQELAIDQNNTPITTFEPFGISAWVNLHWLRKKGIQYKAIVTHEGKSTTHPLPEVANRWLRGWM